MYLPVSCLMVNRRKIKVEAVESPGRKYVTFKIYGNENPCSKFEQKRFHFWRLAAHSLLTFTASLGAVVERQISRNFTAIAGPCIAPTYPSPSAAL